MPHWAPPASRNACWSGSSDGDRPATAPARPSTVRTSDAVDLADRHEARVDDRAVDEDRARAALPFPAALLRAGQPEILAQDVEQAPHPGRVDLDRLAVDGERARRHRVPSVVAGSSGRAAQRLRVRRRVRARVRAVVDRRLDGGLDRLRAARPGASPAGASVGGVAPSAARIRSGRRRQVVDPGAGRIVDRRDDRRRPDVHRQLADALRAVRRRRERRLDEDRGDPRRVERGRDDVRREPVVEVAAVAQLDLLDRRVADRLERAALDLALGEDRVDDLADVVGRDDVPDRDLAAVEIDVDRRDAGRPAERRVGVAVVGRRRRSGRPGYGSNCWSIRVGPWVAASSR